MPRILVVANRTAESPDLMAVLKERPDADFHLVVPASGHSALEQATDPDAAAAESQPHLERAVARLREEGLRVEGTLGDTDPFAAVEDALNQGEYDEVIVSTLPARVSKWIKMDLATRIERNHPGLAVTHVETKQAD